MTHKELLEKFLLFEQQEQLFNIRIENIPIWEYIRFDIFNEIKTSRVAAKNHTGVSRSTKMKRILSNFPVNYAFKNPFNISKNTELLILNHSRRREHEGSYQDIHIDPFLSDLNDKYAVIEGIFNWGHLKPAVTPNLYYLDALEIPGSFARIVSKKKPGLEDQEKISTLLKLIRDYWNIQLINREETIYRLVRQYNYMYPRIEKLLKKIRPKKILIVVSYIFNNQIFSEIARKLNIPVVEVQHGIIGPLHIGYNYLGSPKLETTPDYFIAWGTYWIRGTRFPVLEENKIIGGFPYLDNFRSNKTISGNDKQIIVLSQMSQEIGQCAKELAVSLPDYKILFKCHPTEYSTASEKYLYLTEMDNVRIISDDKKPLYQLFQECDYVVGVNSTALIEALGFCQNIIIMKYAGWEYMENFQNSSSFQFFDHAKEVPAAIKFNKNKDLIDTEEYFAKNATKKTCEFLNRL